MPENDYSARQRKHSTRIATERALMDTFGMSRSQARKLNDGLTEHARNVAQRAPEVVGPPVPPKFEFSETKTEKRSPNGLGRQGQQAVPGGGLGGGGVPSGTIT